MAGSNGFSDDLNSYNRLRDEQRALTQKLPNVGHVDRPKLEREILLKDSQIRGRTDRIRTYRRDVLSPEYRQTILDVVDAKAVAAEAQTALAEAEVAIGKAEEKVYDTWLLMRNSARASGEPIPPRRDITGPTRQTGQISSWTPGLRT